LLKNAAAFPASPAPTPLVYTIKTGQNAKKLL